jgi:molybdopterin synthase sulfur carrier subunit
VITVLLPSQLTAYSGGVSRIQAAGGSICEALDELERRYPGIRFRIVDEQDRIRPHMRLFVGKSAVRDIRTPLAEGDELLIFGALSGG